MSVRALQAAAVGAAVFGGVAAVKDAGSAGIARLAISGAALAAAASFDLSERRIPNRLTMPAALALLVLWVITGAKPGRIVAGLLVAVGLGAYIVERTSPRELDLELFVKVDKDWQRRPKALDRLGY